MKKEVSLKKDPFEQPSDEVKNQAQAIDVKDLSEEDLQSLRKEDPFMYYSIPAIRMATISGKDIYPSDKIALCCSNLSSDDGQQEPASKRTKSTYYNRSKTTVLRRTRISFEAPMNLEDIMTDFNAKEELYRNTSDPHSDTSQDIDGEGADTTDDDDDDDDLTYVLLELLHQLIVEEE